MAISHLCRKAAMEVIRGREEVAVKKYVVRLNRRNAIG